MIDPPGAVELAIGSPSKARTTSSRNLSVLQLGKFYPPHMGGIETHLQMLCGELRDAVDLRVVVASDDKYPAQDIMDGITVSRVPTVLTLASTPLCPGMISEIRNGHADIVHIHLPNPSAVLAYLASGHRGRLVVTYHSDTVRQKILGPLFEPWLHALLRRSSAIIATSPQYRSSSPVLARYQDICHVIPYGIAVDRFEHHDPAAAHEVTARYGDRLIISVGRLVYYKGFEILIRAMQQIRGTLLIVGDGPLLPKLQQLVSSLGVSEKVVFVGEVQNDRIVPYYHASNVFVLPSIARSEAFGIVQIEAMAAGLPVVNTKLDSGVPFVSLDGQTGLTVPPGDADALATAINRLLDDRALGQRFGNAGRERARRFFNLEAMRSSVLDLYEMVISKSRCGRESV